MLSHKEVNFFERAARGLEQGYFAVAAGYARGEEYFIGSLLDGDLDRPDRAAEERSGQQGGGVGHANTLDGTRERAGGAAEEGGEAAGCAGLRLSGRKQKAEEEDGDTVMATRARFKRH